MNEIITTQEREKLFDIQNQVILGLFEGTNKTHTIYKGLYDAYILGILHEITIERIKKHIDVYHMVHVNLDGKPKKEQVKAIRLDDLEWFFRNIEEKH